MNKKSLSCALYMSKHLRVVRVLYSTEILARHSYVDDEDQNKPHINKENFQRIH